MKDTAKFAVVIAAGGSGKRFGAEVPKQFVEVNGYPVIAHTLNKFQNCDLISQIIIVTHPDYVVYCTDLAKELGLNKVTSIVRGGATRQRSVFIGLKELTQDITHVLIHDAARPFVDQNTIQNCCREVLKFDCCAIGVRIADTVKISNDGEFISGTTDRSKLWRIQTPQAFEKNMIVKFHKMAAFDGFEATDDCMIAEKYGARIKLVEGNIENIKITSPGDIKLMEVLL